MDIDPGCVLARPNGPGTCDWDGTPLTGRQRRWCSAACATAAFDNHSWTYAREAALRRDRHTCQRCGYQRPPQPNWRDFADADQSALTAHGGADAAYWDAYNTWRRNLRALEVNHKTPILGLHGHSGCHHHLDGLETLCDRPCHLEETNRQRRDRAATLREVRRRYLDGDETGSEQLALTLFEAP
jgi:hypothetical protein